MDIKLLITGSPGIGKTTLIKKIIEFINPKELITGFYSEEIKIGSLRRGFKFKIINSDIEKVFSHLSFLQKFRVGKYGVDISSIDFIIDKAREIIEKNDNYKIVILDEVGPMECFSLKFVNFVNEVINLNKILILTVSEKGLGFIREIKSNTNLELIEINKNNRNNTFEEISQRILRILEKK